MKVPQPPPNTDELLARVGSDRIVRALLEVQSNGLQGEYFSWERLRFKTPPGQLTHEEWWLGLKMARRSVSREIRPLKTQEGRAFHYALPDELLRAIDHINQAASGNIAISEEVTNPSTRDRYIVSSLIEEAITSSQLEGAVTSRRVAKEMIRSGRRPNNHSEQMIFNNYIAMKRITDIQSDRMTPELVCEIHAIVTDGTLENPLAAGRLQDNQAERISIWGDGDQLLYRPPPVDALPDRLASLCAVANGDADTKGAYLPPILRSMAVHFMMGYDHYFEDGNGRTARALFYWSMLRQGYWLTEFLTISSILKAAPAQYARSFLLTEDDEGDLTHFFLYQAGVIMRAIDALHEYLARKANEVRQLQRSFAPAPGEFNHRQLAVLEHATKMPGAVYTAQSHAASHNVTTQTARNDLHALERNGLLAVSTVGRRSLWRGVDDLVERLRRRPTYAKSGQG